MELGEKYHTPAECYVYRKMSTYLPHSGGVLCILRGCAASVELKIVQSLVVTKKM